ncbi:hypothetical protein Tco_0511254 [Tanacetum coccineum]
MQVVQIILRYLDSGCSKLYLEEGMAPVHNSSGPEPKMMFGQNSSSLVLHQMMSAQISSGLAPQCLKMFEHSSSSLGLHCQKTFKQISSNLVSQMSQRRLLASLQAPFLKEKIGVRFRRSSPFESPLAGKTDITFTKRRVPLNWLMKMKFNRLLNLIWMIMSTIYNKVVDYRSQDDTTGPSVILRCIHHKDGLWKLYLMQMLNLVGIQKDKTVRLD